MRSSRDRRIDRALSSVLDQINNRFKATRQTMNNPSWRVLDEIEIEYDEACMAAYDRANDLRAQWRVRVTCSICGEEGHRAYRCNPD